MASGTVKRIAKHSIAYSFVLSQPFVTYVDAYPILQNKVLLESKQHLFNEHGESTRVLQKKLSNLSYYNDAIDDKNGTLTEYALKKFQSDHHINVTGQANKETVVALMEVEKKEHLKRLKNLSESVYPGMYGENVKIVQESLAYFGYYEGNIDGIYGPLTKKALEIAQEKHEIKLMDEVTQKSLLALSTNEQDDMEKNVISEENNVQAKEENKQSRREEDIAEKENNEIKVVETSVTNTSNIVQSARSFIGTPYVWGGTSPQGFDCSGFVQFVYNEQNITIPRTVRETWNFTQPVDSPSVGDLVFFETYQPGPSHMGIYIGDGKFIHAGESRGVEISELSNSYWQPRYLGAKRINQ